MQNCESHVLDAQLT